MRARNRLLEHALAEAHRELEDLTRRHERLARENVSLRARVRDLEAKLAAEAPRGAVPPGRGE